MGRISKIYSVKILKLWNSWNGCKYARTFSRSCKPIVLKIGDFHCMDRQRAPLFLRFVTQRTFALVMKTKMSHDFEYQILSLPI